MAEFDLIVSAHPETQEIDLELRDSSGQLGHRRLELTDVDSATWQGLFNLRNFVRYYATNPEGKINELGVTLGREILGEEIMRHLVAGKMKSRTLRVQLPDSASDTNPLAAALARVPWEIARADADDSMLAKKNLVIRAVTNVDEPPPLDAINLKPEESLRVLFVFAEAAGSSPLAMRQEREQLLALFENQIYPNRRIEADFLMHGVTRARLKQRIDERGGYHIVHWSGHGHLNVLEIAGEDGGSAHISGQDLVDLLQAAAAGVPRLFFLSACHSGDILEIRDWEDFRRAVSGEAETKESNRKIDPKNLAEEIEEQPGYTGTAHALLEAGVPSVIAMRYAVGDDYARDLALNFYQSILANNNPKTVAAGLNAARNQLRDAGKADASLAYGACDHATPVLYGTDDPGLTPLPAGRSPFAERPEPRPSHFLPQELKIAAHQHFVGRGQPLSQLSSSQLPVVVVQGIGGMGKTALAAEAIDLWHRDFDWVLVFQAKPNALRLDKFFQEFDLCLRGELGVYSNHVDRNPAEAVHRAIGDGGENFKGETRLRRLTANLIRALRDEKILLVLDNFETNLRKRPGETVEFECADADWSHLLAELTQQLPATGFGSRVLITSRHAMADLPDHGHELIRLGPLPPLEAALFVRTQPDLRRLFFGTETDRAKVMRLLEASRNHPLLLDRFAQLAAGGEATADQLETALQAVEGKSADFAKLPDLFASAGNEADREAERAYLQDALEESLDSLIESVGPEARFVLWVLSIANEPVTMALLDGVCSGKSFENERLERFKATLDLMPEEKRTEILNQMPPVVAESLKKLDSDTSESERENLPPLDSLLRPLTKTGLVSEFAEADPNADYHSHELVRERTFAWIEAHPDERRVRGKSDIRVAYGERLEAVYQSNVGKNMDVALEAGRRALVYFVEAGEFDRLGSFASSLVTSTKDPRILNALIPHLESAANAAPVGEARWICLIYLADAIRQAGQPDRSLRFYEAAAAEAMAAENWSDFATISGNQAIAMLEAGDLDGSRAKRLESAEAHRKAGSPEIKVIGCELEAFRIDIMKGKVSEALPEVENRLEKIETWWKRTTEDGETVPEAPNPELLARALISGLDIATDAHFAQKNWPSALACLDRIIEVEQTAGAPETEIARTRMNRANVLRQPEMNRPGEARSELEACLQIFEEAGDHLARASVLSSLASLFAQQDSPAEAASQERRALSICNQLPDPVERASSHNNLASFLESMATADGMTDSANLLRESAQHQLAALAYRFVIGHGQHIQHSFHNYAIRFRRARAVAEGENRSIELNAVVPRLKPLLAEPAFDPLRLWLEGRGVDLDELQAAIDHMLGQLWEMATPEASSD